MLRVEHLVAIAVETGRDKDRERTRLLLEQSGCNRRTDLHRPQMNRKFAQIRPDGYFAVRVFHRNRKGRKDPSFLFKCGCCDRRFELYYGGDSLEISGVLGSVENWRELLMPLLQMKLPGQGRRQPGSKRQATRTRKRALPTSI